MAQKSGGMIFISYASEDHEEASSVCSFLENNQISCWMAPRDILPGKDYAEAIIDAIDDCSFMVLIFSSYANESPHILREVERAVNKKKRLIPFRIEDVEPTKSLQYYIGVPHWLNAFPLAVGSYLEELLGVINKYKKPESKDEPVSEPSGLNETKKEDELSGIIQKDRETELDDNTINEFSKINEVTKKVGVWSILHKDRQTESKDEPVTESSGLNKAAKEDELSGIIQEDRLTESDGETVNESPKLNEVTEIEDFDDDRKKISVAIVLLPILVIILGALWIGYPLMTGDSPVDTAFEGVQTESETSVAIQNTTVIPSQNSAKTSEISGFPVYADTVIDMEVSGDSNYDIGDIIFIKGHNSASNTTYLYLTGTDSPEGMRLDDTSIHVEEGNEESFTSIPVWSDGTWAYTWDTSNSRLPTGAYSLVASADPLPYSLRILWGYDEQKILLKASYTVPTLDPKYSDDLPSSTTRPTPSFWPTMVLPTVTPQPSHLPPIVYPL